MNTELSLKCPVCLNSFDFGFREPKILLSCCHSQCKQCCLDLEGSKVCRVNNCGVTFAEKDLRTNLTLLEIINQFQAIFNNAPKKRKINEILNSFDLQHSKLEQLIIFKWGQMLQNLLVVRNFYQADSTICVRNIIKTMDILANHRIVLNNIFTIVQENSLYIGQQLSEIRTCVESINVCISSSGDSTNSDEVEKFRKLNNSIIEAIQPMKSSVFPSPTVFGNLMKLDFKNKILESNKKAEIDIPPASNTSEKLVSTLKPNLTEAKMEVEDEIVETDDIYILEKIVDVKKAYGKIKFFIKWENYPSSQNTWEPVEHIMNSSVIEQFALENKDLLQKKGIDLSRYITQEQRA